MNRRPLTATGAKSTILLATTKAYDEAVQKLREDPKLIATQTSIGFLDGKTPWLIVDGDERKPTSQVFIKICRFSEELLASKPETGGLFCEEKADPKKFEMALWKYLKKQSVLTDRNYHPTDECKRIHLGIMRLIKKLGD